MSLNTFDHSQPLVKPDGHETERTRYALQIVERNLPLQGDGSPEGVVNAPQFTLYTDRTSTTSGAIDYRKMLPSIDGDTTKGWVAI